jgi:rSAM/selenodomain-associated transferase 2
VNERDAARVQISVIIPAWRDAAKLAGLLPVLAQLDLFEVIVVDASGDDESRAVAAPTGAKFLRCDEPNRGAQMNLGAQQGTGEVLLFQHADTELTSAHLQALVSAMVDPHVVGGAFHRKFDRRHPRMMWMEHMARWLARRGGTLYGDQSVFVRREIFAALGGFAMIPLMEDVEFSRRLRRAGKVVVLDPPIGTSSRRHDRRGAWRTSIQNGLFIVLFRLGVSPARLHGWYYGDQRVAAVAPQLDSLNR